MILLYHKVSRERKTKWYVTRSTFYRQMCTLKKRGMVVVPLKDYDPTNMRHVAITFDGGYEEMYDVAVPILTSFGFEYDIFVIGDYVGKDNAFDVSEPLEKFLSVEHLKEMVQNCGAHLQWHTNSHRHVHDIVGNIWATELTIPQWIKELDPMGFTFFAYPYGGNREWQHDEVKKRFVGAVVVEGGNPLDIYKLPRTMVFDDTDFNVLLTSGVNRIWWRLVRCIEDGRLMRVVLRRISSCFLRK